MAQTDSASPWTLHEMTLLEQHYPDLAASEIRCRFLPHRTSGEIYAMAYKLGLGKDATAAPSWEEDEVALLRTHYGVLSVVELQRHYLWRHTAEEICQKARRLGFSAARHTPNVLWTHRELTLLHRHYAALGARAMQREHLPHRTAKAILHQAAKLGLKQHRGRTQNPHQCRWTDEEVALLREHYGTLPVPDLQRRYFPQRTAGALRRQATGLGLSRADYLTPWTEQEVDLLTHHFSRGGFPAALEALPHRSRTSVRHKVKALELTPTKPASGESWTPEEIERLARLQHLPLPELLEHFPERSRNAVDSQRSRLRHGRR